MLAAMLRMMSSIGFVAAVLGCSGSGSGSGSGGSGGSGGSTTGSGDHALTIGGRTFALADAVVATTVGWKSSLYPGDSTIILLSDSDGLCDQIQANVTKPGTQLVILDLAEAGGGTARPVMQPGTFPVSDDLRQARAAAVYYTSVDPACAFSDLATTAGSVTLTALLTDKGPGKGSVSATLDSGAALTGDFTVAHTCPTAAVDAYLNRTPKCQ